MPLTPKRVGNVAYSLVMFVGVSVLAGVLVAGLFVPAAGVAGLSARSGADQLENLPAELATPPQSERSRVLLGNGKLLANFYDENRVYVPLAKIAPVMRQAQVAIEDHRYYEHGAVDVMTTLKAAFRHTTSDGTAGASSITQQYVKMVRIETAAAKGDEQGVKDAQVASGREGISRKILELRYAVALERKLTKDQILERYLNIAYYGDNSYGVEAAAHHYFNTTAAKLTLPQAAMLAGLVQNPTSVNPVANPQAALDRRNVVINRMAQLNLISATDAAKAKKSVFDRKGVRTVPNGCQGTSYPFMCEYVKKTLLQNPALGKTVEERANTLNRGGLTIQTAIDPATQDVAQKQISKYVRPTDPVISTMTMIQPGTGLILAMAQSRPVMGNNAKAGETQYNYAVERSIGGYQGFQAGSTFKAITAATALSEGIPLSKRYTASARMNFGGKTFESCDGPFSLKSYPVGNSTNRNGNMNMQTAAEWSVNTYFVQLEEDAGLCDMTKMAEKLGVKLNDQTTWESKSNLASLTLGSVEVSPMSMSEAYATFAARGIHCNPHIIASVKTKAGKSIKVDDGQCKRVIDEDVADAVNQMLSGVVKNGTGRRATIPGGYPQAGKTGTTNDNKAVWFAGYTPEIAGAAMIAVDPTMKLKRKGLKGYYLPENRTVLEGSGSGDAGQWIYKPAMTEALKDKPKTAFNKPSSDLIRGKMTDIPATFGMSPGEIEQALREAGFSVAKRNVYNPTVPAGTYMYTTPQGRAPEGSTITMVYSGGKDPAQDKKTDDKGNTGGTGGTDQPGGGATKPPAKPGG